MEMYFSTRVAPYWRESTGARCLFGWTLENAECLRANLWDTWSSGVVLWGLTLISILLAHQEPEYTPWPLSWLCAMALISEDESQCDSLKRTLSYGSTMSSTVKALIMRWEINFFLLASVQSRFDPGKGPIYVLLGVFKKNVPVAMTIFLLFEKVNVFIVMHSAKWHSLHLYTSKAYFCGMS